jgi:hypothetical protein
MARWCVIAAVLGAVCSGARAAEPHISVDSEGRVVARATIDATESAIRGVLADTTGRYAALSSDVLSVESVQSGRCEDVTRSTRGLFRPLRFRSMRCPTNDGFTEVLIESRDFSRYSSEWALNATDEGTEVVYVIDTDVNAPVPDVLVKRSVKQAATELMTKLADAVRPRRVRQ